jgi:hypothetical protein
VTSLDTYTRSRRRGRGPGVIDHARARLAAHTLLALVDDPADALHFVRCARGATIAPPGSPRRAASDLLNACGRDLHGAVLALRSARAELEAGLV